MSAEKKSSGRQQELHLGKYHTFGKYKNEAGKQVAANKRNYKAAGKFLEVKPVESSKDKRVKLGEGGIRQNLVKQFNKGEPLYLYHLDERLAGLPADVAEWLEVKDIDVNSDNVVYFNAEKFKDSAALGEAIKTRLEELGIKKAVSKRQKLEVHADFMSMVEEGTLAENVSDLLKEMKEAHSQARKKATEEKKAKKSAKTSAKPKSKKSSKPKSKAKAKSKAKSKPKTKSTKAKAKEESKSPRGRSPSELEAEEEEPKSSRSMKPEEPRSISPSEVVSSRRVRGRGRA